MIRMNTAHPSQQNRNRPRVRTCPGGPRGLLTGFTLAEGVVAVLILAILVAGTVAYYFHSSLVVRKAETEAVANRLALLFLEGWKGTPYPDAYDPVHQFASDLDVTAVANGPGPADGFTGQVLGHYQVMTGRARYRATLAWRPAAASEPRMYHVRIAWQTDLREEAAQKPMDCFQVTTYARN